MQYWLTNTITVLSLGYFVADIIVHYLFQNAEKERRKDLLDHSLSTNLADQNSSGYYTNDTVPPGAFKLGVNSFESCFYTHAITERVIRPALFKILFVLLVYVIVAISSDDIVAPTVLQMALPITILQQFIRLLYFKHQITSLYESFKTILQHREISRFIYYYTTR